MAKSLLEIKNLHVQVEDTPILRGIDLVLDTGQIHAIMGPNGSGKSTLSYVLAGRDGYEVTKGDILLDGESVLEMEADERARAGMFLAFQYPVELPGVGGMGFLRAAVNAARTARGEAEVDHIAFAKQVRAAAQELGIKEDMLKRTVNVGFSGGEKKRYEILQMKLLAPRLAILDETDSGLDIDALRIVAEGVNKQKSATLGVLLITHYQRLLDYITPDNVHIMVDGRIAASGDKALALEVEKDGYAKYAA